MINIFMNIWCFGDSWTWGAELWDDNICPLPIYKEKMGMIDDGVDSWMYIPENRNYVTSNRWTGILESDYGHTVRNFGENGASNNQILETLIHTLEHETTLPELIIISWTSQYRYTERVDDWKRKENSYSKHKSMMTPNWRDVTFEDNFFHIVNTAFSVAHEHNLPMLNINSFFNNKVCNKFPKHIRFTDETLLSVASNGTITNIPKTDWHIEFKRFYLKILGKIIKESLDMSTIDMSNFKDGGHPNEQGHKLIAKYINEVITNENI